jgi:hypothetical protein
MMKKKRMVQINQVESIERNYVYNDCKHLYKDFDLLLDEYITEHLVHYENVQVHKVILESKNGDHLEVE